MNTLFNLLNSWFELSHTNPAQATLIFIVVVLSIGYGLWVWKAFFTMILGFIGFIAVPILLIILFFVR